MNALVAHPRLFHPMPGKLLVMLLALEGILLLANWFHWIPKGWAVLIAVAAVGLFLIGMLLWFVLALVFHRRFQFSLRSLLVLTVAVAIPFSWLAVEMQQAKSQKEVVETLLKLDSWIYYDYEINASGTRIDGAVPLGPAWLHRLVGNDFFGKVIHVTFNRLDIDHVHFECVGKLNDVPDIRIFDSIIKETGLRHLQDMKQVTKISFNNAQLSDVGMEYVSKLSQLQKLSLYNNNITDTGIKRLGDLKHLRLLVIEEPEVTDAEIERLYKALPNVDIWWGPDNNIKRLQHKGEE